MPAARRSEPAALMVPVAPPARERPQQAHADSWEMIVPKMERPARAAPATVAASADIAAEAPPEPHFTVDLGNPPPRALAPALAAGVIAAAGVIFYFGGWAVSGVAPAAKATAEPQVGALLPIGLMGWTTVSEWPRRLSLLRGSSGLRDFRMEFEGTIESKALGWVFRAIDARNYYAMKLEIVTPGRDPVVVLKRFAVIDGRDRDPYQLPLPGTYRLDTIYKVRVDVLGDEFTTWVQDRKIDRWNDARLGAGSLGLFSEAGERGVVKGVIRAYRLTPQ